MFMIGVVLIHLACLSHGDGARLNERHLSPGDSLHTSESWQSQPNQKAGGLSNQLKSVASLLLATNSPNIGGHATSAGPSATSSMTMRNGAGGITTACSQDRRDTVLRLRGGLVEMLQTEEELDMELDEAGNALVVVDFYADWCGPCKKIAPVINSLAEKTEKTGKVKFFKVNVDEARDLMQAKEVKSMPTLLFYRKGKLVNKIVGADIPTLNRMVAQATGNPLVAKLLLLRNEKVLIATAIAYLVTPWQRILA